MAALNLVCFPEEEDRSILEEMLKGGAAKLKEAQCSLVGGHSIHDPRIKYGLCVMGILNPRKIYNNSFLQVGDKLILTKPLGVSLLSSTRTAGECPPLSQGHGNGSKRYGASVPLHFQHL